MKFTILPEVEAEIETSADYYRNQESGLEKLFIKEIKASLIKIETNPARFPIIELQIRKYVIRQFPFNIIYELLPNEILILALAHHKREPGYWKKRSQKK